MDALNGSSTSVPHRLRCTVGKAQSPSETIGRETLPYLGGGRSVENAELCSHSDPSVSRWTTGVAMKTRCNTITKEDRTMDGICMCIMQLAEWSVPDGQRGRDLHAWSVNNGKSGFRHPICADLPMLPANTVGTWIPATGGLELVSSEPWDVE